MVDLGIQGRPGRATCHLEPHKQDVAGPGWGRFYCCSRRKQDHGLEGCRPNCSLKVVPPSLGQIHMLIGQGPHAWSGLGPEPGAAKPTDGRSVRSACGLTPAVTLAMVPTLGRGQRVAGAQPVPLAVTEAHGTLGISAQGPSPTILLQ